MRGLRSAFATFKIAGAVRAACAASLVAMGAEAWRPFWGVFDGVEMRFQQAAGSRRLSDANSTRDWVIRDASSNLHAKLGQLPAAAPDAFAAPTRSPIAHRPPRESNDHLPTSDLLIKRVKCPACPLEPLAVF